MIPAEAVERLILTVREQKVILDSDLAALYGVTTKRLNEQFRHNRTRFPEDFAFQLRAEELASLRSQIATTSEDHPLESQSATLKKGRGQHRKYRPYVFTEHGALPGCEHPEQRTRGPDERICRLARFKNARAQG